MCPGGRCCVRPATVLRCRARLRAGTLYTALDRLRADELIGVDREEIVDSRLRRHCRLTTRTTGTSLLSASSRDRVTTPGSTEGMMIPMYFLIRGLVRFFRRRKQQRE